MMNSKYSVIDLQRLAQAAGVEGCEALQQLPLLSRSNVPNHVTDADQQRAEQLLLSTKASKSIHKPTIPFKRRKLSWNFKAVTAALPTALTNESAGVLQALLRKGGNDECFKNQETKVWQQAQRSMLLLNAVELQDAEDKIEILALETTKTNLNDALRKAVALTRTNVVRKLVQCGAVPSKEMLLTVVRKGQTDVLAVLLRAPAQSDDQGILEALGEAVSKDARSLIGMLCATNTAMSQTELEPIATACQHGRYESLLNILICCPNLSSIFLDRHVLPTFESTDLSADIKFKIIEALLRAGAIGDGCSAALVLAVERKAEMFVDMLVQQGADVNWGRAKAVRLAVQDGDPRMVKKVLANNQLRAEGASDTIKHIPNNLSPGDRQLILKMLLDAGARGQSVDEQLVLAVQTGDEDIAKLLRDNGASPDGNNCGALVEAVKKQQTAMVKLLLSGPVDYDTLASCFPLLKRCSKQTRHDMAALLLQAGARGDAVHAALRDAVCSQNIETSLIDLLLQHSADPTFNHLQALRHVVTMGNVMLLRQLLNCSAKVTPAQVGSLVHEIVKETDPKIRARMLQLALEKGPTASSVSQALCYELESDQSDIDVVSLLIRRGDADISYDDGKALMVSAGKLNRDFLNTVMTSAHVSTLLCQNALKFMLMIPLFTDEEKAQRASILLNVDQKQHLAYEGLKEYVQFCQQTFTTGGNWPMGTFHIFLEAKPELNQEGGEVFLTILASSCLALADRIVKQTTFSPTIIDRGLELAVFRDDEQESINMCSVLLQSQPSTTGLARALIAASRLSRSTLCSKLLHAGASLDYQDQQDGQAMCIAVDGANVELVALFMSYHPSASCVANAFERATQLSMSDARLNIMRQLLPGDLGRAIVDRYLSRLVRYESNDVPLIDLVLGYASVGACGGESLVFAAEQKKLNILEKLWIKVAVGCAATRCFDACVRASGLQSDGIPTLRFLLQKGVTPESINQALVEAVDATNNGAVGLEAIDLLLEYEADVNFKDGHALCEACSCGRSEVVRRLCDHKPSLKIRAKALHYSVHSDPASTSADEFCMIIDQLTASRGPDTQRKPTFADFRTKSPLPGPSFFNKRPNHPIELKRVLEAGMLPKQTKAIDVLYWAIARTTPKIKVPCLELLVEFGAGTTFVVPETGETMAMLAIKTERSSLLPLLISKGVDLSLKDNQGRSPLLLATEQDDSAVIKVLLHEGVSTNDGSLNAAVRRLAVKTVELLLKAGHDPWTPSPCAAHNRKPAIAELIYSVKAVTSNYHLIWRIVELFTAHGLDLKRSYRDKPLICHCIDNGIEMTEAMLRAGLARSINDDCSMFNDGQYCYSPTMYIKKIAPNQTTEISQIWAMLKDHGAERDVYYALQGAQPEDAVGMPAEIEKEHFQRLAKAKRDREEAAAHDLQLRRLQEQSRIREEITQQEHAASLERTAAEAEQELRAARDRQTQQLNFERQKREEEGKRAQDQARWLQQQQALLIGFERQKRLEEDQHAQDQAQRRQQEREQEYAQAQRNLQLQMLEQQQKQKLEQDFRKQLMLEQKQTMDAKVQAQKLLMSTRDLYAARRHDRAMKEMAMSTAIRRRPVPTQGFVEDVEDAEQLGWNEQRLLGHVEDDQS